MVMVTINNKEHYFDGYAIDNLDALKKFVSLKWDGVIYVGGYEGDGKTTLASQWCYYLDPSFNMNRVCFTPQEFMEAVDNAKKGEAILYDEAQEIFDSSSKDSTAKMIKMKMTRIRKKGLYIFICAADFWRINKYLFIHRSRAFVRIYSEGFERGRFAFYNRERKHDLYIKGRKEEKLCVPPNFIGAFTNWSPLNDEEYDKKKEEATKSIGKDTKNDDIDIELYARSCAVGAMDHMAKMGLLKSSYFNVLSDFWGVSTRTISNYRSKWLISKKNSPFQGDVGVFRLKEPPKDDTNNLLGENDE